jgi:hypothetical protein
MLSKIVSMEELAIEPDEAKQLAEALDRVNELYDFSALSPKAMAWINLLTVAGGIYGPRVLAVSLKPSKAKAKKQAVVIDGDMFASSAAKQ